MKRITSIPAHYRSLGETEKIRVGDLYYCTLDKSPVITRIKIQGSPEHLRFVKAWPEYKFFRRKHVVTRQSPIRIALNQSVKHWDRLATGTSGEKEGTGCKDCALCQMFFKKNGTCEGCPVANYTGEDFCNGSPYPSLNDFNGDKNSPRFKKSAARFRDWLKQLPIEDEENG